MLLSVYRLAHERQRQPSLHLKHSLLSLGAAAEMASGEGPGTLTRGEPAGQTAVQGLGVDVQGPVELPAVPLAAPLQMAQEVTQPHTQGRLGVPELGVERVQGEVRLEGQGHGQLGGSGGSAHPEEAATDHPRPPRATAHPRSTPGGAVAIAQPPVLALPPCGGQTQSREGEW